MKLVVNGQIQSDLTKLPYSEALIRGDGLFETMLAIDNKPVALDRHLARIAYPSGINRYSARNYRCLRKSDW
jgi:branched-subunit amino acid aminotransferase/4-amino-4-deoxychorismate lyase